MPLINRYTGQEATPEQLEACRRHAERILASPYSAPELVQWAIEVPGVDVDGWFWEEQPAARHPYTQAGRCHRADPRRAPRRVTMVRWHAFDIGDAYIMESEQGQEETVRGAHCLACAYAELLGRQPEADIDLRGLWHYGACYQFLGVLVRQRRREPAVARRAAQIPDPQGE